MQPLCRVGDIAFCPSCVHGKPCCASGHPVSGPATVGSPNVFVNGVPALRLGDPGVHVGCCGSNTWVVAGGSAVVLINGIPAARLGDPTTHCGGAGVMTSAAPTVLIK